MSCVVYLRLYLPDLKDHIIIIIIYNVLICKTLE